MIEKLTGTSNIQRLGGLFRKIPGVFIAFCIGAFSLIGLPPFGGFISRWIVFKNCFEGDLWFLGIAIVLTAIISTINIFRIILGTFGGEVPTEYEGLEKLTIRESLPMWIASILCLLPGLYPYYITKYLVNPAVSALYGIEKYVDGAMGTGFAVKWLGEQEALKSISFIEKGFYSPMACLVGYLVLLISIGVMSIGMSNRSLHSSKPKDGKKNIFGFLGSSINYLQKINDDLLNEYSLVIVSVTAILLVFMFIFV
jgi:multicomponent Na+:H+ antiporter subunit D